MNAQELIQKSALIEKTLKNKACKKKLGLLSAITL